MGDEHNGGKEQQLLVKYQMLEYFVTAEIHSTKWLLFKGNAMFCYVVLFSSDVKKLNGSAVHLFIACKYLSSPVECIGKTSNVLKITGTNGQPQQS